MGGSRTADDQQLYEPSHAVSPVPPLPDVIVYLGASVATLQPPIRLDGPAHELIISGEDLEQLNARRDDRAARFSHCPALTIPTDSLDIVARPDQFLAVAGVILEAFMSSGKRIR